MQNANNLVVETVKVPYPVLVDKYNVVAKSDNVSIGKDTFFGIGKLMILLYPFDNILKFIIASKVDDNKIDYMDLTNMGEIKLVIKNQSLSVDMPLYAESGEIDLSRGFLVFRLISTKINDVRKIYESGVNVFYITSTHQSTTTVIYTGLYTIYDSVTNVTDLNQQSQNQQNTPIQVTPTQSDVLTGTAVVTRRIITTTVSGATSST